MRLRLLYASVIITIWAVASAGGASAQNASKSSTFAPVPTPTLDPDVLKIPDSVRESEATKFKPSNNDKALPPPSAPNKVDLGTYDLEFKAGQTSDVNPRTGFDSGEKSNLSNSSLGTKSDSVLPDYFGLKLSRPTK